MSDTEQLAGPAITLPGLGTAFAAFIIVSETAGSGILALPQAMVPTGFWGCILLIGLGVIMAYNGYCLGQSYLAISPPSSEEHRDPFPLIAEKAGAVVNEHLAKTFRLTTIVSMVIMNYGSGVVFLLLIAQYVNDLMHQYVPDVHLSFCSWIVICGALIVPTTWLGSPKDLGLISFVSVLLTFLASGILVVQIILDYENGYEKECPPPTEEKTLFQIVLNVVESYSTIMFSYAGASVYPSIQSDMKVKSNFKYSAFLSIGMILVMYIPVSLIGYGLIGDCVGSNVILNLSPGIPKSLAEILLILHLYTAITIFLNPVHLYFEQLLHIPTELSWKRIVFRTGILTLLTFFGLSMPEFSNLLDLIGSGPSSLLNFILPPIFYMLLMHEGRNLPLWEKALCTFIALSGLAMGLFGLVISIKNISYSHFTVPCYLNDSSWSDS